MSIVKVKETIRNLGFHLRNNTPLNVDVHLDGRSKPQIVHLEQVVGRWAACNLYLSVRHLRSM